MVDKNRIASELEKFRNAQEKFKRYEKHDIYRGSAYPPMSIEPFPHERQRLSGMTDADRLLRKQWLADQILSPNEPRFVQEVHPRNFFRRVSRYPWDIVFKKLEPFLGATRASVYRKSIPKMIAGFGVVLLAYNHLKYSPNTWETNSGWGVVKNRERKYDVPSTEEVSQKAPSEFYDRGFMNRGALLDCVTSTAPSV